MSDIIHGPVEGIWLISADEPAGDGGRLYLLLPTLGELLGVSGFAARNPICLPGSPRPLDGWALFGEPAENFTLH